MSIARLKKSVVPVSAIEKTDDTIRLHVLQKLRLLDSAPEDRFDRFTRMASYVFNAPISAVSLTDRDRQWFKSRVGIPLTSVPRDGSPCAKVAESKEVVLISDLLADECYADSLLADAGARFYLGAPLVTREGFGLGSLCVIDTVPRSPSFADITALTDLAAMVMAQIELRHASSHTDPISGLPNRTQFLDDLYDLATACPQQHRFAVLVDLARTDQLTTGYRVMGALHMDDLIRKTATIISAAITDGRSVYQVAPAQFAFISLPNVDRQAYMALLTHDMAMLQRESAVRFVMTPAIGLAPFVTGNDTPHDILRAAYCAVHDARTLQQPVAVYSPCVDHHHRRRFQLLNDFGQALEVEGQLRLVFQPRVDLKSQQCLSAEALLRWKHPTLGDVSPSEFIPIVETSTLANPMTTWVLDAALKQLSSWQAQRITTKLSVNISAINLEEPDFALRVISGLSRFKVLPEFLELEMTESSMMEKTGTALAQLETLSAAGIGLALDDFGTGYSSFSYLNRLPINVIKIDRSFITHIQQSERDMVLVKTMIALCHDLGFRVVAEGIETQDTLNILCEMGCDEGQGYFFARALEDNDLRLFLRAGQA